MPRALVVLTVLVVLGAGGYAGQVWWARSVAQWDWDSTCAMIFPDGHDEPQINPGGYLTADTFVGGAILMWKDVPWYGQIEACSPNMKFWVPRRRIYELLRLATGEQYQNDPESWESWLKAHPDLVWVEKVKRAVPFSEVQKLLKESDPKARIGAAWVLGQVGEVCHSTEIAMLLEDTNAEVRKAAAWALVQPLHSVSAGSAVATLLKGKDSEAQETAAIRLINDGDTRIRRIAMHAVGELELKSVAPSVVQALRLERNRETIRAAAWALGRLRERSADPLLMPLLADEDPYMRLTAASALGRLGNQSGIPIVAVLLEDQEPYLQGQAANVLQELTGHPWSQDYAVEKARMWWAEHQNDPQFVQAGDAP